MNTELQTFDFNGHVLRIFPTDDGQSFYAVAKDATDILGYQSAKDGLRRIPDKHKGRRLVPTPGGSQEMLCVAEPGLYRLILRSDKPEAEPLMELVTSSILPSIRKTGGYIAPNSELAKELAIAQELLTTQKQLIAAKDDQIAYVKSQADAVIKEYAGQMKLMSGQLTYKSTLAYAHTEAEKRHREEMARVLRSKHPMTELEEEEINRLHRRGHDLPYLEGYFHRSRNLIKRAIRNQGGVL
ncbi:MAG: BRO family protein [Methylovulum sp.]|nr:BRO family protein [Methylovulum sp.]